MADFFGEGSIEDILRSAANEVLHSNVPEGFVWIEEYGQYYSESSKYFYDPNNSLFYNSENMTYYRFNEETYEYEVVECRQPTKWSSRGYRKRAKVALGEAEFRKLDQEKVDLCQIIFGLVERVVKEENAHKPQVPSSSSTNTSHAIDPTKLTADDLKRMLRKRKTELQNQLNAKNVVFDELSGDFVHKKSHSRDVETHEEPTSDDSDYDECARLKEEERYEEAPMLRIVDSSRRLHIVTMFGGVVGASDSADVVLQNKSLPQTCIEVSYCSEIGGYSIEKVHNDCSVQVNSAVLKTNAKMDLVHGDVVHVSGEKFFVHVHYGANTCAACEPGLIEEKPQTAAEKRYVRAEVARRREMRKLMASYGITPDESVEGAIRLPRKPVAGPSLTNIRRDDVYGGCAAKPIPESQRQFSMPQPSTSSAPVADVAKPIDAGNVGFRLLKSMGWSEGKGLGKEKQGIVAPIETTLKNDRQGLGTEKTSSQKPKTFKEQILEKTKMRYQQDGQ